MILKKGQVWTNSNRGNVERRQRRELIQLEYLLLDWSGFAKFDFLR